MDVSLSGPRVFRLGTFAFFIFLLLQSCGNRYDLSTERGRRARIDDANFHLSKGECSAADEAIGPLYASQYVDDEVRIVKASALACFAQFRLLTFVSNLSGVSNFFQAFAKSLSNSPGDNARSYMYQAVDVLTQNGAVLDANSRGRTLNSFMVFLQFGVLAAEERNYGSPTADGSQGADLVYEALAANPAGEMTDEDACATAASFSHISDSYNNSDLSDGGSLSAIAAIDSVCVAAGLPSCASISRNRSSCDGTNANSITAASVVSSVNASW